VSSISKVMGGLVLAILTEGFFFWSQRGCNGHPKPPGVSGGGNMGLDNGQPVRSQRRDRGHGKRWWSDVTASYGRGTEKDGVQRSEQSTVMVRRTRRAWGICLLSSGLQLREFSKRFYQCLVCLFLASQNFGG
jgi:hypothetical protein